MTEKSTFAKPAQTMLDTDVATLSDDEVRASLSGTPVGGQKIVSKNIKLGGSQPAQTDAEESVLQQLETSEGRAISDSDKHEFIRATLGSTVFMKTYDLFGDAVKVTFKTLVVSELANIGGDKGTKHHEYSDMVASMTMLQLKDKPATCPANIPEEDSKKMFNAMSVTVYAGLISTFRDFKDICDTIFEAALSPDFWLGTGGAS